MTEPVEVRPIRPDEWRAYRALRLEALEDTPKAFGEDHADAKGYPDSSWKERFRTGAVYFGAFRDGQLLGTACYVRENGGRMRHRAGIYGVYISPVLRGSGASSQLMQAVLDHARAEGCLQVHLGVGAFNAAARKVYERLGFEPYGTEPRALIVDGEPIDEILMVHFLDK